MLLDRNVLGRAAKRQCSLTHVARGVYQFSTAFGLRLAFSLRHISHGTERQQTDMTKILNRAVVTIAAFTLFVAAILAEANEVVAIQLNNGASIVAHVDSGLDHNRQGLNFRAVSTTLHRADVRMIKYHHKSISIDDAEALATILSPTSQTTTAAGVSVTMNDTQRAHRLLGFTQQVAQR